MMPEAIDPAIPSAAAHAAAAPSAPITAVGRNPALWIAFEATMASRHSDSVPTAMPARTCLPGSANRSPTAKIAGRVTALERIGPPSKVLSKSSPRAVVLLMSAVPYMSRGYG